jgi:hypothetical protein
MKERQAQAVRSNRAVCWRSDTTAPKTIATTVNKAFMLSVDKPLKP